MPMRTETRIRTRIRIRTGNGQFGEMVQLKSKPTIPGQLVDVDGDGNNELLVNDGVMAGYFSYIDGRWENFAAFRQRLNLNMNDEFRENEGFFSQI